MSFLTGLLKGVAGNIPLVGGVVQAGIGALEQHNQNKAAQNAAKLTNQQAAAQDKAKADVLAALRANGWDPAAINNLTSSSTGSSQSSTSGSSHTNTYNRMKRVTEAEQQPMENLLRSKVFAALNQPQAISASEKLNQVRAINDANASALSAIKNAAGARGLSGVSYGNALAPVETARTGAIANYLGTTVPGLNRDLATQARSEAENFLNARAGSENFGTSDTRFNQNTMGSSNSSGTQQVAPDANLLLGLTTPTPTVSTQTGNSALLTGAQGLIGALGQWYGNRQQKPATPTYTAGGAYGNSTPSIYAPRLQ